MLTIPQKGRRRLVSAGSYVVAMLAACGAAAGQTAVSHVPLSPLQSSSLQSSHVTPKPFTIESEVWFGEGDAALKVTERQTFARTSSGVEITVRQAAGSAATLRELRYPDGRKVTSVDEASVHLVDLGKVRSTGPGGQRRPSPTADCSNEYSKFVEDAQVLGVAAKVFAVETDDGVLKEWRVPSLGCHAIMARDEQRGGINRKVATLVWMPVSLGVGEPPAQLTEIAPGSRQVEKPSDIAFAAMQVQVKAAAGVQLGRDNFEASLLQACPSCKNGKTLGQSMAEEDRKFQSRQPRP